MAVTASCVERRLEKKSGTHAKMTLHPLRPSAARLITNLELKPDCTK
jgi:hypothetical protein